MTPSALFTARAVAAALTALAVSPAFAGGTAWAAEVSVVGIFSDKALLVIDDGEPRTVSVGKTTAEGVKVLAIDGDSVTLEVEGVRRVLRVGQIPVSQKTAPSVKKVHQPVSPGKKPYQPLSSERKANENAPSEVDGVMYLPADRHGFFFANGTVNEQKVRFIVDTGAADIVLGAGDAQRIGIDTSQAPRTMIRGVGEPVEGWWVTLPTVQVGSVTLHNARAKVASTEKAQALLGMNFLKHMEISVAGNVMTLRKKIGEPVGEETKKVAIDEKAAPPGVAYLPEARRGQFHCNGAINGRAVRFTVDTGAMEIIIGASEARRLEIDTSRAPQVWRTGAGGKIGRGWEVTLPTIQVGGITMHDLDALVSEYDFPSVYLGSNFLRRTEISRDGNTMVLRALE